MKMILSLSLLTSLLCLGCRSAAPTPKPTLTRGWIGGEYDTAQRQMVPKDERTRVYVKEVYVGTPAEQSGLRLGDLIVAVDDQPITKLAEFRRCIDRTAPGTRIELRVHRDGEREKVAVVVGEEKYQNWHAVQMGFGFSTKLDGIPNPDFSLLPIAQYRRPKERLELRAAETILAQQARQGGESNRKSIQSDEGWKAWFLVFGLEAHKYILSQEPYTESSAAVH